MSNRFDHLPRRPLPAFPFRSFTAMFGPGTILASLAMGGAGLGATFLLTMQYGLWMLWLLLPAVLLIYPLAVEAARYPILTGEGLMAGLVRLNRPLAVVLWLTMTAMALLTLTLVIKQMGLAIALWSRFPHGDWWLAHRRVFFWALIMLVGSAWLLLGTQSPYKRLQLITKYLVAGALASMACLCMHPTVLLNLPAAADQLFTGSPHAWQAGLGQTPATHWLAPLAMIGAGGCWMAVFAYWVRESGAGMAGYRESPEEGDDAEPRPPAEPEPALPRPGPLAQQQLKKWSDQIKRETLLALLGAAMGITLIALLAAGFATTLSESAPSHIANQGTNLGVPPYAWPMAVTPWHELAYVYADAIGWFGWLAAWLAAAIWLIDAWAILTDGMARLHADMAKQLAMAPKQGMIRFTYRRLVAGHLLATVVMLAIPWPQITWLILPAAMAGTAAGLALIFDRLNHAKLGSAVDPAFKPRRMHRVLLWAAGLIYAAIAVGIVASALGLTPRAAGG